MVGKAIKGLVVVLIIDAILEMIFPHLEPMFMSPTEFAFNMGISFIGCALASYYCVGTVATCKYIMPIYFGLTILAMIGVGADAWMSGKTLLQICAASLIISVAIINCVMPEK